MGVGAIPLLAKSAGRYTSASAMAEAMSSQSPVQGSAWSGKLAQAAHAGARLQPQQHFCSCATEGHVGWKRPNMIIHSPVTQKYPAKSSLFPKKPTVFRFFPVHNTHRFYSSVK